jgi:hypothetical protein
MKKLFEFYNRKIFLQIKIIASTYVFKRKQKSECFSMVSSIAYFLSIKNTYFFENLLSDVRKCCLKNTFAISDKK